MNKNLEPIWNMANNAAEMKLTMKKLNAVAQAFANEYLDSNDFVETIRSNWEQFSYLFWALEGIIADAVKQAEAAEEYSGKVLETIRAQEGE